MWGEGTGHESLRFQSSNHVVLTDAFLRLLSGPGTVLWSFEELLPKCICSLEPKLGHEGKKQSVSIPRVYNTVGRRLGRQRKSVRQKGLDAKGDSKRHHCSLQREMYGGRGHSKQPSLYLQGWGRHWPEGGGNKTQGAEHLWRVSDAGEGWLGEKPGAAHMHFLRQPWFAQGQAYANICITVAPKSDG